ncbi:MAG: hypothetical protein AVDCRST_MAG86-1773 [uncultured Truepera sp.]|uniref:Uncharacterized protein n=1 Tax=uncultured Truepera sp. TaxID=543023 RepID=A0A6J4VDG7_9DEIN|nr:MAG: hypothetical protein AVDCRST_MAG86-1773 [uncultured Truepera sp.]
MLFTGVVFDVGGTLVWPCDNFYETADATTVANTLCAKGLLDISRAAGLVTLTLSMDSRSKLWAQTHVPT